MTYEHKNNTGSLFKNEKRETENHPNATGSCLIDGVEYFVSAWTKEGAKGKWQSLAFKRKEAKQSSNQAQQKSRTNDIYDEWD